MMSQTDDRVGSRVVVIGAGIGGLTASALLAHRGYSVLVLDQALVPGGCASTFKRQGFTFDVGATQVAGLEPGGIHHRIFAELGLDLPAATHCDPACAVYLPGETEPINVWRDPQRWQAERQRQFPGSEPFWQLLATLFQASWAFQSRDPVLPPRNLWDLWQLTKAVRPETLLTLPHTFSTVGDALRGYGLAGDRRLRTFLDLQLKLYSQVDAEETALLYAATALSVSQAPQGLFHLHGSMQALSDRLHTALERHGGKLLMRHAVETIQTANDRVTGVTIRNQKTSEVWTEPTDHVVANVTVQNLMQLLGEKAPKGYQQRVDRLPPASGAFVVYLGVDESAIPEHCPPHLQFLYDYDRPIAENNSLFVSVSRPGDGRAPAGKATIIASSFTNVDRWWEGETLGAGERGSGGATQNSKLSSNAAHLRSRSQRASATQNSYHLLRQSYTDEAIARLAQFFKLTEETILHVEAATPRTFEQFTGRDRGAVGGIGQRVPTFGPFGFANRTPVRHLWLVGDSTHPGEGTAGVSYSALTTVRQIEAERRD
ncbi:C-3',4' desaturase CrtD [Stenomitos frigidus]|nr:C-3',4' desaturase CrtD [Stenomitos frigidus]